MTDCRLCGKKFIAFFFPPKRQPSTSWVCNEFTTRTTILRSVLDGWASNESLPLWINAYSTQSVNLYTCISIYVCVHIFLSDGSGGIDPQILPGALSIPRPTHGENDDYVIPHVPSRWWRLTISIEESEGQTRRTIFFYYICFFLFWKWIWIFLRKKNSLAY